MLLTADQWKATAIESDCSARKTKCDCNCPPPCNLELLQLHPNLQICPHRPSSVREQNAVFRAIDRLRFSDGFAWRRPGEVEEGGGELGGSNWGVIEVTKRVERNIPGIPGHSSDHLPYLPTLGPAGFLLLREIFFSLDTLSHEVILATYLDLVLLWTSSFASNQKMFLRFLIQFRTLLDFPLSSVRPSVRSSVRPSRA